MKISVIMARSSGFIALTFLTAMGYAGIPQFTGSPQVTWTLQPESSNVWVPDPYFGALGNNAYDIFAGIPVDIMGWKHPPGGSLEQFNGGYLVYRWRLDFSQPVQITSITMKGFGDQTSDSVMRLLDYNKRVIASQPLSGIGNVAQVNTLTPLSPAVGTTFYYDEFDVSWDGRVRSGLSVAFKPAQIIPVR